MNEPLFLIECTDNRGYYIHRQGHLLNVAGKINYILKEGKNDACMFSQINARMFIEQSKANNLEVVVAE